ncbi:MAG: peptidase [Gammaproteobacteria bacterium]|nr:peptidase [Gammaproteobacteria bacterium]NNJ51230.1 peptidase [Gammaproteobacteria bacterium]
MQDYFYSLSDALFSKLQGDEQLLLGFSGEDSDFVRMNHNRIRQAGSVAQRSLSLDLIRGKRHAQASIELSGEQALDMAQLDNTLNRLREQRELLPEDPYLVFADEINSTEYHHDNAAIVSHDAVQQVIDAAGDMDLVGLFANGIQYTGFANSMGQRNWHSSANFNLDWSCYLSKDKAVKGSYAGFDWQPAKLAEKMDSIRHQLSILSRPSITLEPGNYRAYLSPSAVNEIINMMSWGGFGLKSHRTKSTPLLQMVEQDRTLDASISLREHHGRGLVPIFTGSGFIKPDHVQLIRDGRYQDCLISSRSAMEYGEVTNVDYEYPGSLELAAGELNSADIVKQLDTGLYINNLWYLNFSDRNACQMTGMTRFACFWVERGEIQAPVDVMRFDDSIYNLFGTNLLGLTKEREMILDPGTYGQRSDHSIELPGLLVSALRLTL